jgi:hypothetical protein
MKKRKSGFLIYFPIGNPARYRKPEFGTPPCHDEEDKIQEKEAEPEYIRKQPADIGYPAHQIHKDSQRHECQNRLHCMEPDKTVIVFNEKEKQTRNPESCIAKDCFKILINPENCVIIRLFHEISPHLYTTLRAFLHAGPTGGTFGLIDFRKEIRYFYRIHRAGFFAEFTADTAEFTDGLDSFAFVVGAALDMDLFDFFCKDKDIIGAGFDTEAAAFTQVPVDAGKPVIPDMDRIKGTGTDTGAHRKAS